MTLSNKLSPLSSIIFVLFTACSGGYLSVSNNPDVYRPAAYQVSALEKATPTERAQIVQNLYGKRGDNLNWEEFWSKLRLSAERDSILGDVEGPLLALHERGCTEPGYAEFVRLVVATGRGYAYVIGDSARCDTSLGAELSAQVTKGYLNSSEGQDLTDSESELLLKFLNREIEASPEGKWREFCKDEFEADIRRFVEANLAAGRSKKTVSWMVAIHRASGKFPLRSYLFERIITSSQLLGGVIEEMGFAGAVVLVADLIDSARNRIESGQVQVSPSQATALVNQLWGDSAATAIPIAQLWPDFSRFKRTLLVLGKSWSLRERLALQNTLLLKVENSVRAATNQDRDIFFNLTFNTHAGSPADLDTLWLMLRVAHDRLEAPSDRQNARALLLRISGANSEFSTGLNPSAGSPGSELEISGIEERILAHRLAVHLADGGMNRRLATEALCGEFEKAGLGTIFLTLAEAKQSLTQGLEAGCYRMPLVNESDVVTISGQTVRMSPDAVLRVDTPKMILQVAQAELGILDLSRSETVPFYSPEPKVKSQVVIPVPLIYQVMQPPAGSPIGKHVIFFHLVLDQVGTNSSLPRFLGKQGGILSAQINEAPRTFAFVSQGGPGGKDQRRDRTIFREEMVQAFLAQVSGLASIHRASSVETLTSIEAAGSPLPGEEYAAALLKYLQAIPATDSYKKRMEEKCKVLRPGFTYLTDADLVVCLNDTLIPMAIDQATASLSELATSSNGERKDALRSRFDGYGVKLSPEPDINPVPALIDGPTGLDGVAEGIVGGGL